MQSAPTPQNEQERLNSLISLNILDTPNEKRFDDLTREASQKLNVPIAIISLIDKNREWFKSCVGLDTKQSARDISFCGHAMLADYIFIVEDTLQDPRFANNPQVVGKPFIRFYAGIALHNLKTGLPVGVFCVKDTHRRKLTAKQIVTLIDIAKRAEAELNKK